MPELGKWLVVLGLLISAAGLLLWLGFGKALGHLPGDLHYSKGNTSFHFPLTTCLIVSALVTFFMWLFRR